MKHLPENIPAKLRWGYPPNLVLERGGVHHREVVEARLALDAHYGTVHDSELVEVSA